MADEWEDEVETAKPVGGQQKYGSNNFAKNKTTTDDDDWGGSSEKNNNKDDWSNGGGNKSSTNNNWSNGGNKTSNDDDWGSGGNKTTKNDDWGSGGSKKDTWGSGPSQSNGSGGGGRQRTNWMCTVSSCGMKNFGNRTECFKCSEPKGNAVDIPADDNRGGDRGGRQRTNWMCTISSCGMKNFGNRTECFKCSEPKGNAVDIPADDNRSGDGGSGGRQRTNWMCTISSCGMKNFGNRTECFKCSEPKGDAVDIPADDNNRGGGGGGNRGSDWICTSCSVNNFASRFECFKCKEPKGDAKDAPSDSFGFGNGGGSRSNGNNGDGDQKRKNDWTCPADGCGNSNFGFRTECQKCSEKRPESAGGDFQSDKPKEFYIPAEIDENELFTKGISSGINFDKFRDIPVKVSGDDVPPKCTSFADSGLNPFLLDIIRKCGYKEPTPIQKTAIPIVMKGRDIMACAQTGSGKTAAFLLPIINTLLTDNRPLEHASPEVLIITPTRELAKQIHFEARKFSKDSILKSVVIYGGTATRHDATALGQGFHILVATPGRLIDYCENKQYVSLSKLRFLVLDEADRMLDMGFAPAIEKVVKHKTMSPANERQTLMFSATFPSEIQTLAGKYLSKTYLFITIGIVGGANNDVEQNVHECSRFEKRNKLMEILNAEDPKGTMVFVETKRNADFLASFLSESKHKTTSIHGDRLQRQREEALSDFTRGKMKVLIATSVAARGLDIPGVRHVINFDLPKSIDDYVHRIGRTGRVGNEGKATSFYDPEQDSALVDDLVKILQQAKQKIPDFLAVGGAGGGNGSNGQNQFGGRDIRNNSSSAVPVAHGGGGDDEEW